VVAARLLQLKVRGRRLQAGMPLAVRLFDRTAWARSRGNWYSKESPLSELLTVRFRSVRSTSVILQVRLRSYFRYVTVAQDGM
jgi:hypothetical protein